MNDMPIPGELCYVDLTGEGTYEGEVISEGRNYVVRILETDELVNVPDSAVWTTNEMETA